MIIIPVLHGGWGWGETEAQRIGVTCSRSYHLSLAGPDGEPGLLPGGWIRSPHEHIVGPWHGLGPDWLDAKARGPEHKQEPVPRGLLRPPGQPPAEAPCVDLSRVRGGSSLWSSRDGSIAGQVKGEWPGIFSDLTRLAWVRRYPFQVAIRGTWLPPLSGVHVLA